ncbi:MAG: ATP-dependent helicase HrpB [Gammaproteobacteria bacterium]|nr:ATP-dependent helicase HrpB [Gammaproteobacteria bacterium]
MTGSGLPIDAALPALRTALAGASCAVLQAPPGAGKSTVVPLALLTEPWVGTRRILLLEPRRLAARAVAERMSVTLGEAVGATVGYRMRFDTCAGPMTRIEVITEGVLTRMLQDDPALEGVALVIFDEFHERSLQADLGLALALDAQEQIAPGLRLLAMSATLDGERLAALMRGAPVVAVAGRQHVVDTRFVGRGLPLLPGGPDSPERFAVQIVMRALREEPGDLLVFLPGAGEIRRVQAMLEERIGISAGVGAPSGGSVRVLPLYGDLHGEVQRAALTRSRDGARRVVLATNIAETSLTIEGVRVVIDSGLVRRARFDPASGMSRLETARVSRASADQRRGRAGRLGPGVCYRLWSEGAHGALAAHTPPEIVEADLAPLALELASWGASDALRLRWLDAPPAAMLAAARELLVRLGALDAHDRITAHGREMQAFAAHPRLAHLLLRARELGVPRLGAELAALLSERDFLRGPVHERDADLRARLALLRRGAAAAGQGAGSGAGLSERGALLRIRRVADQLERPLNAARGKAAGNGRLRSIRDDSCGALVALAYPDRIGRRRPGREGRYLLSNGRGAHFEGAQSLARSELIVAAELDDREREARILLAAPLTQSDLEEHFAEQIEWHDTVHWDTRAEAVAAVRRLHLGALVLDEKPLQAAPSAAVRAAMLEGLEQMGLDALPWTGAARDLQARMEFVRSLGRSDLGEWPDVSGETLARDHEVWLGPWLDGVTRRAHLGRIPVAEALRARLDYRQQQRLEELAPAHLEVPGGAHIRIDYSDPSAPAVAVRLQEVFGTPATPRIGGDAVAIVFHLLSPAQRPLQVTRDLASFWRSAYAEVRKDMRGRYPKHYWPEDPLQAEPRRGMQPRSGRRAR